MKLYARFLKWAEMYKWHNACLRELNTGFVNENKYLRHEIKRWDEKVEYLLIHRMLLTEEVNALKGKECKICS